MRSSQGGEIERRPRKMSFGESFRSTSAAIRETDPECIQNKNDPAEGAA